MIRPLPNEMHRTALDLADSVDMAASGFDRDDLGPVGEAHASRLSDALDVNLRIVESIGRLDDGSIVVSLSALLNGSDIYVPVEVVDVGQADPLVDAAAWVALRTAREHEVGFSGLVDDREGSA
jgi:hypothetical protein